MELFVAMGVVILEGYGLTESSAATHVNLPTARRIGTVGPALPGDRHEEIAEDGEVLIRGPWVMRAYRGLPEQTAEALNAEGFLHTGDVGHLDADGFLTITDRKKDLIKTSRRQVRRTDRAGGAAEGALPRDLAGARPRRPAELHHRARDARRRRARPLGGGERARGRRGRACARAGGASSSSAPSIR